MIVIVRHLTYMNTATVLITNHDIVASGMCSGSNY